MTKHKQRKHRDIMAQKAAQRTFVCDVCGASFKEKRYINDHLRRGACSAP
jgi:hypothetical protein